MKMHTVVPSIYSFNKHVHVIYLCLTLFYVPCLYYITSILQMTKIKRQISCNRGLKANEWDIVTQI